MKEEKKVLELNSTSRPLESSPVIMDFVEEMSQEMKTVAYRQMIAYDNDGNIVYDVLKKPSRRNGSGFVISYTEKMCDLITQISKASVLRVFMYIAHHQQYGNDGIQYGYRCSHKFLQQVLGLDRKSVYNALQELKGLFLINESKIDGQTEFMVNPQYITIGTNKSERVKEWNRRWEMQWKAMSEKRDYVKDFLRR